MTEAIIQHSYKAVLCRRCREPIPVPGIVIRMDEQEQTATRVFTLRCRICENENLYQSRQVIDVAGEPRRRRQTAPEAIYSDKPPLGRAANA